MKVDNNLITSPVGKERCEDTLQAKVVEITAAWKRVNSDATMDSRKRNELKINHFMDLAVGLAEKKPHMLQKVVSAADEFLAQSHSKTVGSLINVVSNAMELPAQVLQLANSDLCDNRYRPDSSI